jgi:hypothetical protein
MPYTIQLENRLLEVQWTGVLDREDLESIFHELPRRTRDLGFGPDVLHNFDAVTDVAFVLTDLVGHSRKRVWTALPNAVRSAAVGTTPLTQAHARAFQSLNANPKIDMRVFSSRDKALAWLAEPRKE